MQASLDCFYWRLCAQYDSTAGLEKPAADNKPESRGALAISGDGAFMAAIPPSATHCYILELVAGSHIIQHAAVKPETPPEASRGSDVQKTHCALSYSGSHLAVAVSNGYVWVFDRSGQQQCKAHHKDWLKNQILDVFFASEQAASVVTQGGLLYNVDLTSGVVSSVSSVKEHMAHPLCCAFDPASKTLALAGQGAGKAGTVCLTLWHILSGSTPTLLMQHGRPARQGFFSRQKLPLQPWQLSLCAESRTCLIAVPGGQLHVFRWQDTDAKDTAAELSSIAIPSGQGGACLWGRKALAAVQPAGALSAIRLDKPNQSLEIAQCSSDCVIKGLPAEAPGECPRVFMLDLRLSQGTASGSTWRLNVLDLLQPEDELDDLLAVGDYGAASALAKKHSLPQDLVLKHQWRSSCSLCKPDLQILGKVADKIWAVQQCLHAVAPDSELQAKLIGLGLAGTDAPARAEAQAASNPTITTEHQAQQDTEPDSQPDTESHSLHGQNSASSMEEQKHAKAEFAAGDGGKGTTEGSMECSSAAACQWRVLRLSLLRHKARLQTHMDIHHGSFHPAEFKKFRDCSLAEAAAAYAAEERVMAVEKLLSQHPVTLMPHLLHILSAFPETMHPTDFLPLLSQAGHTDNKGVPDLHVPEDWVESKETVAALRAAQQTGALLATERLALLSMGWQPPSARQVDDWRMRRVGRLKVCGGQLEHAKSLLAGSSKSRSPQMQALRKAARSLSELLRPDDEQQLSWDLDLNGWATLDTPGRMQLLVGSHLPVRQLRGLLARLLAHEQPQTRTVLLCDLMVQQAQSHLAWCAELLTQEAQHCQAFPDASSLAQAACSAAFACSPEADWDLLQSMVVKVQGALDAEAPSGTAPAKAAAERGEAWEGWDDADEASSGPAAQAEPEPSSIPLKTQLQRVGSLASAAAELKALDIGVTLQALQVDTKADAQELMNGWLAVLETSKPPLSEHRWTESWRRLKAVREAAALNMTNADVLAAVCGALLRCQVWRLAGKYLGGTASTPLPASTAEALVLRRSRELLRSAASFGSQEIAQAQACLKLLPSSPSAASELAFIQCVERLKDYAISMSPLQCLQMQNRMDIIQLVLDTNALAYRDAGRMAMLAEQLGLSEQHAEVMLRQARAACRAGDLAVAHELALQLAVQQHPPAWQLVSEIKASPGYKALQAEPKEQELLKAFILAHCPTDQVGEQLLRCHRQKDLQGKVPLALSSVLQCTVTAELPSAVQGAVPDMGDAAKTLACLLEEEPLDSNVQHELLQSMHFAASRAFLLLRMTANALLALSGASQEASSAGMCAAEAQDRLHKSPWRLLQEADALDPGMLCPAARAAQQRCRQLSAQLGSASNERMLRALLPGSAVHAFVAADSSAGAVKKQQMAALMQVISAGVQKGDMAHALAQMQQAAAIAARYQLSTWPLHMHLLEALLITSASLQGADEALQDVIAKVLQKADEALHRMVTSAWPRIPSRSHAQLQMFLGVLTDICRHKDCSQEVQQSLQSALQFVQRVDKVAPHLDSKWFVAPVIAMALQHMSPELSRKVLQPLMAEGTDVSEHTDRAPAKQPLKRALFPELQPNGNCEGDSYGSALGAVWHRKAINQVSAHISAGNATQLAALLRSLPIQQALAQLQGPAVGFAAHTPLQLTYSSVLLLHLVQALPGPQGMPEAHQTSSAPGRTDPLASAAEHSSMPLSGGLEPVVAQLALHRQHQEASLAAQEGAGASRAWTSVMGASVKNAAVSETATEEAYRRCRKHLRQLEAHHLAALLRFWLLHGPAPVPGVPGSRPELRGALRLRVLQDGVAALARCVDKPHGASVALTGTEQHPLKADAERDNEKLSCLQQQLQQEAESQGLIARIQEHAALTVQQEHTVLKALTFNADASQAQQPSISAPSLPATLQRLVVQSCQLQTVALVAHELQSKLQSRKSAAVMTSGNDLKPDASALEHGAAAEQGLCAACSAVVQVTSEALNAAAGRAREASHHSRAGLQASETITASLHSALSSLEGISEVGPVDFPWSQQDYIIGLNSARDQVWALLQGALMPLATAQTSSSSPSPRVLALLSAAASIVPLRESECSERWPRWRPAQPMPAELRMLLLFSATRSALEEHFQLDGVVPASVGDAAAAESLFLRMLARAESAAQLKALQALLEGVWDSGHAFQAEARKPVTAQLDALFPLEASCGKAATAGKLGSLGSLPDADTDRAGLKVPYLVAALSNEEQPCKQQGSAPGTPPAEESRWATEASQTDGADGWDNMENMALVGESALPAAESAAAASQVDAADGWDDMEQVGLPSNPAAPAQPLANGSAAASVADAVECWEAPEDIVLPSNAAGPALFAADSARTALHADTARSPAQPAADSSNAASLAEDAALPSMLAAPALPAAESTEGWDSDDDLILPPEASQGAATMPEQEWQGPTVVSEEAVLADRHGAEASAAGTAPAVDGWDTDERLDQSLGAEDTAKAHDTVAAEAAIFEAPVGGAEPVRKPKESLPKAAVVPSAASSKICVRRRTKGGALKLKATKASRAQDAAALAAAASPDDAAQSATESHDAAEEGRRSSLGAAQPAGEEAAAVPLHACWAALLRRILSVPDRALAGHVLMRLEKAGLEGVPLVSAAEAGDIVAAAETAGADLAVAVGLLLPFSEQQTAAEGRLHALADLPEPADVSLVAVLQARRLWPKADSEPAYSQLAQSLMDHAVLPTEKERGGLGALEASAGAQLAHAGRQSQGAFPGISNPLALLEPHLAGSSRLAEAGHKTEQGSVSSEADDLSVPEAVSHVWGMLRGHAQRALKELRAPK